MRKLFAFFTSNWGLKILALVLAIVVYYSMKDSVRSNGRGKGPSSFLEQSNKGPADGGK